MSLVGFGVKNLRCLTDTGIVPIKPITLLVGKNSSGTSTFLRAFPLLRQSVENPRRSPVLWQHKGGLVDFGSVHEAIKADTAPRSMSFMFSLSLSGSDAVIGEPTVELTMTLAEGPQGAYIQTYVLRIHQAESRLDFNADGRATRFSVHGRDFLADLPEAALAGRAYLVPWFDTTVDWNVVYQPLVHPIRMAFESNARSDLLRGLRSDLVTLFAGSVSREAIEAIAEGLRVGSASDMLSLLQILGRQYAGSTAFDSLTTMDPLFRRIMEQVIAAQMPNILMDIDIEIAGFMSRVRYLGPRRSVGDRTYQHTETAVDEVQPHGDNLPDFLLSLSEAERTSLASFTRRHLGFEVGTRTQGLTVEVLIKEAGASRFINIADVGFGYAEVLPLCVMLWSNCVREPSPKRRRASLVALEQPELHLHPARQARLARMIVGAMRDSHEAGLKTALMVETHSDAVVNQLGMLIRAGRVRSEDVQILLFDQDPSTRETKVVVTGYQPDGVLRENWPFGFLIGALDELDDIEDAAAEE